MFSMRPAARLAFNASQTRSYGTHVTRSMFPRSYRPRSKVSSEAEKTPLSDGSLFVRRNTAPEHGKERTSILSSTHPSPSSVSSSTSTTPTPLSHPDLPPPLKSNLTNRPQFATLTEAQIEEMQRLRQENPAKYTRKVLAEKFNVSDMFVKCYVPAAKPVQEARIKAQQRAFAKKGWRAQEISIQRQKRRELW
ncbi:hypothetical protein DFQ27_009156 [Actinomortierella ambigua]|uniref:Mitochondrial ribosomal protein subunit L20-domain-containing protein n=1 Tax=Actinomortierella ambigua TaxID=1343610 RepID=A0A9P6TXM1_9FUNG|nr:hypothetical protein DFQ27_009156 [Actinomortierella ambigua]